ncbi:cyclic nucleotide-binding domain-containing protein [Herpetosiphon geysericola]|uniref:Cyclic nucleotide-binding domain-containing protein n=1 Tax=Herpetosiphon geysericola TaxID=70996 RepID=A0A0P6Y2G0_9CHLR|nr:cyclic nucleotide-binding domain-containing protein [Herpetosiphon geysericola]KPL86806.1 hypothetical protein SE18_12680 [Herpetosiphon geysericola]
MALLPDSAEQPTPAEIAQRLADVPLFEQMRPADLDFLAHHAQIQQFDPAVVLSAQQASENDLYVVIRGHLEVWLDPKTIGSEGPERKLATLFADEIAGELALVDGGVRSARLQAGDAGVRVICISQTEILNYCEHDPIFGYRLMRNLAAMLALRARLTTLSVQTSQP